MKLALSGKDVISSSETARMLGISVSSVRNWVRHGFIESVSAGNDYVFRVNDVVLLRDRIEKGDLKRLSSRANKIKSSKTFLPDELLGSQKSLKTVSYISDFIVESGIDRDLAMFMISLNLLYREGLIKGFAPGEIFNRDLPSSEGRVKLHSLINEWKRKLMRHNPEEALQLLDIELPDERNIAGAIYQSILLEGDKSRLGSYYTPDFIVDNISSRLAEPGMLFLDPCCGTGQFLLSFAGRIGEPENLYGIDVDPIAVNVARVNLILEFKEMDFIPNIYCHDSLVDLDESYLFKDIPLFPEFDVIATNPPWGSHFGKSENNMLKCSYPDVLSGESFSYFIVRSLRMLKNEGMLSFVLPESFLNVKIHSDIREYILKNCAVKRIEWGRRIFKNVFTSSCIVDIKNSKNEKCDDLLVINEGREYSINRKRFINNRDFNFDIHLSRRDEEIINRVYSLSSKNLTGRAAWALGIVTGNNSLFLSETPGYGMEPVITGKDISPFSIARPSLYIKFEPEKFQQCSPENLYRCREKLVYRFISRKLIFAIDNTGSLTLNSANIIIPAPDAPPAAVIMAFFNSELYQYIFQKKFASVKVLKSHIEDLPLPDLKRGDIESLVRIAKKMEEGSSAKDLNSFIYELFSISETEMEYIKSEII